MKSVTIPALPSGYVDCTYRREQRALIGTWSAQVLLTTEPEIGDAWNIEGIMKKGLVTAVVNRGEAADGRTLWAVSGYDAGFRLMKSCPLAHELTATDLPGLIVEIATYCDMPADVTMASKLTIPAKSLVSAQTCAQAVLDLALYGGAVAYVTPDGVLRVAPPVACGTFPDGGLNLETIENKDLDLDGYASGVVVTLGRRGAAAESHDDDSDDAWTGSTPSGTLTEAWRSGSAAIPGGVLSWSYRILQPIGAVSYYQANVFIPNSGIAKTIVAEYEYDVRTSVIVSNSQEQRLWVWGMTDAGIVETSSVEAAYYNAKTGATECEKVEWTATQTIEREYDADLTHVAKEVQETKVVSDGAAVPADQPPQSRRVERSWIWDDDNGYRGLSELEWVWENKDIGVTDTVTGANGEKVTFSMENGSVRIIRLPAHQTTVFTRRVITRQTDEIFDDDGKCVSRIERETDDNGVADMLSRGLFGNVLDPGNADAKASIAWLKALPQYGSFRVQQMPGSSSISAEVSTLTQAGKRLASSASTTAGKYTDGTWGYETCPFLCVDGKCGVLSTASAATVGGSSSATGDAIDCPYLNYHATPGYEKCSRYVPYRDLAGTSTGSAPGIPVVGIAGDGAVWFEKELYVDADLSDDAALKAAQTIARNILNVKGISRGVTKTVTIPAKLGIHPDGGVIAVEHDFGAMRTRVTYRPSDIVPPNYVMFLTSSSAALALYSKESIGKGRSAIGQVAEVRPDRATVILAGRPVSCSSSVRIKRGDNVLVFLPPGSVTNGIIQAVMK